MQLTTVGEMVGAVRYQGAGSAFLMDGRGEIIYFTAADLDIETMLSDLDTLFEETTGFQRAQRDECSKVFEPQAQSRGRGSACGC